MLAYRTEAEPFAPPAAWQALSARVEALTPAASHDAVTAVLVDAGEIESAIADRLFPDRDGLSPLAAALRRTSLDAAAWFLGSWRRAPDLPRRLGELRRSVHEVDPRLLPPAAERRVSEGYAYYALHPETYAAAAERLARVVRPDAAVVVGIRSIGTSLSAVVGAALAARGIRVETHSVRPRGHPFDRELRLDDPLQERLCTHADRAVFLIVDEGPGLSGSSFACTAAALSALGVPAARIHFVPSWDADGSAFKSAAARTRWNRHARWIASPAEAGTGVGVLTQGEASVDWSAGAWRPHLLGGRGWPAVNPQHERVKRYFPERREIVRFAGLGRYGAERLRRAELLAEGGYGPAPVALAGGYLRLPFSPGTPCRRAGAAETARLAEFGAGYAAYLARTFPAGRPADVDSLHRIVEVNLAAAAPSMRAAPIERGRAAVRDTEATALDGRMLVHEFIAGAGRFVKVDALDHAADHFYPGPQDIAWDLAALEAELGLDDAGSAALLGAYRRASGDVRIGRRMPFYRLAYAAFQIGYATLSSQSLAGSPDGERFARRARAFTDRARALAFAAPDAGRSQ
jgi:hypothetical protein